MKILDLMGMSKDELEKKKQKRTAKALARKQASLVDKLEDERDDLVAKRESLLEIKTDEVNVDTWAEDFHRAKVNITLKEKEIEIAKETEEEYFSE